MRAVVLGKLDEYATRLDRIARDFAAIEFPDGSRRWVAELRDGIEIDRLRTRFSIATYEAIFAHLDGHAALARSHGEAAAILLDRGRAVVKRRHADLHDLFFLIDPHGRRLLDKASDANSNRTFYQYGYLYNADTLCFWQRELVQVEGILGSASATPPGCLLP